MQYFFNKKTGKIQSRRRCFDIPGDIFAIECSITLEEGKDYYLLAEFTELLPRSPDGLGIMGPQWTGTGYRLDIEHVIDGVDIYPTFQSAARNAEILSKNEVSEFKTAKGGDSYWERDRYIGTYGKSKFIVMRVQGPQVNDYEEF